MFDNIFLGFLNPPALSQFVVFLVLYVFLTPPALPGVPVVRFHVWQAYSLSSLAFKRVTQGSAVKTQIPSPLLPQIPVGVAGCLEHTNNLRNLGTGTPI